MKQEETTWDGANASGENAPSDAEQAHRSRKDIATTRSSTERGAAADKALIDAGGAIVSRLRLRPIAARALAILMEREDQTHGKQRAAIERALIDASGGTEVLEQLAVAEVEAAQAAAEAEAIAQAEAAAEALKRAQRPRLSAIETKIVVLLEGTGQARAAAEIGYSLWPDRDIGPQGAGGVAGRILRRMLHLGYVEATLVEGGWAYEVTASGVEAREQDRIDAIDARQMSLLEN